MGRLGRGGTRGWGVEGGWRNGVCPRGRRAWGGTRRYGKAGLGWLGVEAPEEAVLFSQEWGDRKSVEVGVWGLQEARPRAQLLWRSLHLVFSVSRTQINISVFLKRVSRQNTVIPLLEKTLAFSSNV